MKILSICKMYAPREFHIHYNAAKYKQRTFALSGASSDVTTDTLAGIAAFCVDTVAVGRTGIGCVGAFVNICGKGGREGEGGSKTR